MRSKTPQSTPNPEVTDRPHPPRLLWTKRIAKSLVVLLIVLIAARFLWGYLAARKLQFALNNLASTGLPTTRQQIEDPPVPDDRNAALVWIAAMDAVDPNHDVPAQSNLTYNDYPPYSWAFQNLLDTGVEANSKSVALTRQARLMPEIQWSISGMTKPSPLGGSYFNMSRNLANVIADASLYSQFHGDDAEALERVLDTWGLAKAVEHDHTLIADLISIGIRAMALNRLSVINAGINQLTDSPAPPSTQPWKGPANRKQMSDLIRMLLAASDDTSSIRQAMIGEQASTLADYRELSQRYLLLHPMYEADTARNIDRMGFVIRATDALILPGALKVLDSSTVGKDALPAWLSAPPLHGRMLYDARRLDRSLLGGNLFAYSDRLFITEFRVRNEMKLVAAQLAVRLYWLDHHAWPTSIDELVPNYLPAIPPDPFSDHRKLGYLLIKAGLPDGKDRPVVYDLGESPDAPVDATMAPAVPTFSYDQRNHQFRDATMWSPTPATTQPSTNPSTSPSDQAIDHDPKQPDQPGQDQK